MKKIISIILIFIVLLQVNTKPIENQPSIINSIEDVAIEKVYTYLSKDIKYFL